MFTTSKKPQTVVGLDIESGSVAATEVKTNGSRAVGRTAIAPLHPGIVNEGEVVDTEALSDALRSLFAQHKLGKDVRLGVANQRVVVRTLQLPLIEDEKEIDTAVRFRAQDQIPMPLDQAVLDHRVVSRGKSPEGDRQMEVIAVAARRDMVVSLLAALRKAGLKPVGIDLSAFGMIRALDAGPTPPAEVGGDEDAQIQTTVLYCYLGDITNLAVARGGQCLFTRVAPFGMESIAQRVAERAEVSLEDARDSVLDVGLEEPIDSFEGDEHAQGTRDALEQGATKLVDELRLSLDFYSAQEGAASIERVVLCGPGGSVPGLPERVQAGLGLGIEVMVPAALRGLDPEDAARLTVSYGLAIDD
ncbi:MAG TPA: type IV pilus assembly protein PilM [Solirubrobacterales bacterium]|nr:type IV pilus assembly protein PilM [Solirubrobacterales bacterium]